MSSYYNINGVFNGFLPGMVCPFIGNTNSSATTTTSDPSGWIIANGQQRTNGSDGRYNGLIALGIGTGVANGANYTPIDLRASDMRGIGSQTYNDGTVSVAYSGPSTIGTFNEQKTKTHNHTATMGEHTHDLKVKSGGNTYDVTGGGNYSSTGTSANPVFGLFAINGLDTQDGFDQTTGELNLVAVENMNVQSATPSITIDNNTSYASAQTFPVNYGVHWIMKL
jgi:hypothetical protein